MRRRMTMFKNMSLTVKYVALFLIVAILPLLIITILSYQRSRDEIQAQIYRALDMYTEIVDSQLEGYF